MTSSPHYAKANSKAESLVKTVKQLFKKAERDGEDPWLALLDYRSTPIRGLGLYLKGLYLEEHELYHLQKQVLPFPK